MTLQTIRALIDFTRPYPWAIPVLVLLGLTASIAEGVGIGLLIPLLDAMLQQTGEVESSGPLADFMRQATQLLGSDHVLLVLSALIIALIALKTLIVALDAFVSTWVIARAMGDLRLALVRQLLDVSYEYFGRIPQGNLVNILDSQTYRASESLRALTQLIGNLSTATVFVVLLLLLSWQLTIVVAALVLPISLAIRLLASKAHAWGEWMVESYSELAARILELLVSMRSIRLFNRESTEIERFDGAVGEVKRAYQRTEVMYALLPALVEFMYVPVFVLVLVTALHLQIDVPTVLVFMLLLYRLQNPLKMLHASRIRLATYAAGIRDLHGLLDRSDKPYLKSGTRRIDRIRRGVEFDRVSFSYLGSKNPALRDISLVLRAGTVNAIVGDSGAGKSTLINLLCRLHDPASGVLRVDGIDLRELDLTSWRSRIALAGQDAELLNGSVRFNITYGVDTATEEEIEDAARVAQAHEFILGLPDGYQSEVGPRGTLLSGGQRQRVALARAILRRPDILILDEATNAVDGVTETAIQSAVDRISQNTTVVLVAHRLNTLKRAQFVVVMSGGQIIQQGAPCELLAVPGPLRDLYSAHRRLEQGASDGR
ncbi:MAG: ABC transporter ATP-binding protein [Pirellulaceae bacterium]